MRTDLEDSANSSSIITFTLQGSQKRKKRTENLCEEIVAEDFPSLGKETDIKTQELQRFPNKVNTRKYIRHIVIKMTKSSVKERILRVATEKKTVTYE